MDDFYNSTKLEKDDFYLTKEGYRVFTEKYLLKRGYCCQNGCRHCPYKKSPTSEWGYKNKK